VVVGVVIVCVAEDFSVGQEIEVDRDLRPVVDRGPLTERRAIPDRAGWQGRGAAGSASTWGKADAV